MVYTSRLDIYIQIVKIDMIYTFIRMIVDLIRFDVIK
jgi:hypothetical protein